MGYPVSIIYYILKMDGAFNLSFFYRARVLYDRPTDKFRPITLTEKKEFLFKLAEEYDISVPFSPLFKRFGFIVSSTSWTEDEDFSILLNALQGESISFKQFFYALIKGDCTYIIFFFL